MVAALKIKMELPDFTEDRDSLVRIMSSSAAIAAGGELYLGIVALRKGEVVYGPNLSKNDGSFGWKGVRDAASKYEIPAGAMSKITKVVQAYMPEVVTAELTEVKSMVLGFTAEHGTVSRAYDKLRAADQAEKAAASGSEGGEGGATGQTTATVTWSLTAAITTVITKAVKEGFTMEDVQEAFHTALVGGYGAQVDGLVDATA